jgi:hypothetical protein
VNNHELVRVVLQKHCLILLEKSEFFLLCQCLHKRKNAHFAGSDDGAKAIAIHLSFIASAKRNRVNPVELYADVLSRVNALKTNEIEQLLPHNWSRPSEPQSAVS